jgi:hypothetical protein
MYMRGASGNFRASFAAILRFDFAAFAILQFPWVFFDRTFPRLESKTCFAKW